MKIEALPLFLGTEDYDVHGYDEQGNRRYGFMGYIGDLYNVRIMLLGLPELESININNFGNIGSNELIKNKYEVNHKLTCNETNRILVKYKFDVIHESIFIKSLPEIESPKITTNAIIDTIKVDTGIKIPYYSVIVTLDYTEFITKLSKLSEL